MMDLPDWQFGFALIPRTALRPTQSPYWATTYVTVPANSYRLFTIGKGFSIDKEWIESGERFSIWYVIFSIDQNSLIEAGVGVEEKENPGTVNLLALRYGYGKEEIPAGIFFDFEANTRPVYYIANYSSVDVTCDFIVFGVIEKIV